MKEKPAKKAAAKKKGKAAEVLEESNEDVVSEPPKVSQNLNTKKNCNKFANYFSHSITFVLYFLQFLE